MTFRRAHNDRVIRRRLRSISPEELVLIPVVVVLALVLLWQPTAITRLFDSPYATPAPGVSPADQILRDRTPAPAPPPVTTRPEVLIFDRSGTRVVSGVGDRPAMLPPRSATGR